MKASGVLSCPSAHVIGSTVSGGKPGIGEYGPTQRNETLWNIAKKVRHSGVAMEQMVMSLFHANPDAFISRYSRAATDEGD